MREEERVQILTRKTTKSYNDSSTMCGPVLRRLVRLSLHPLSPLVMDSTNKTVFLTSKFPCARSLPVSTRTSYRPCPRRRTQGPAFPQLPSTHKKKVFYGTHQQQCSRRDQRRNGLREKCGSQVRSTFWRRPSDVEKDRPFGLCASSLMVSSPCRSPQESLTNAGWKKRSLLLLATGFL